MFRKLFSFFFILPIFAFIFGQDKSQISAEIIVRTYVNTKSLPDSIFNMKITTGKKVEFITLNTRELDLSTNNYRQAFRKTPGIFVSDHDASGLQTSISTRGLSANRSWEFNMRQNGYDISADPSGYPESYYSPTLDAVSNIQIYRGSSALQYGSQFGGMINYQLKDQLGDKPFNYEGSHTAGSFGLYNSFNAISGKQGAWTYFGFIHHRQAEGFRANSRYFTNAYFGKIGYQWKLGKISAEYHQSHYLSQQAGGLHDTMALANPDTSLRQRNWFELPWKMASIQLNQQFKHGFKIQALVNFLNGHRNSIGYMKPINIADTFNTALNTFNHRDIDIDIYNTFSSEIRFNQGFKLGHTQQTLTGGLRYCLSDIQRKQKGIGSGNSDFDLSVTPDNSGDYFQKDLDLQTKNFAAFAEQLFTIGKRLSVIPGYRLESISSLISGRTNAVAGNYINGQSKQRLIMLGGVSTKYSVVKNSRNNASLYANANQNYRPVTYSELLPSSTIETVDQAMQDVTGYSSEAGIKGNFFVKRILFTYDVNAFFIRYNNKVGTLNLNGNPYKTNIGDLESKGIEFYTEVMLLNPFFKESNATEQINLYVSGTVQDARYKRWNNPSIAGNELTSIVGKLAEYAPGKIIRAGLEYKYKALALNYQFQYTGACYADAANTLNPNATATVGLIPAYSMHDASISFSCLDNYQIKCGVNNLLNEISIIRRSGGYPGPGALTNQGRSFYMTLSIKI